MEIGKVPNSILESQILSKLSKHRNEVLLRPGVGEDCSAIEFGGSACVLSCDPITGTAMEIGKLSVHISCNDIASCGAEPVGLMATILCPPGTTEKEIGYIMEQMNETASSINVDIIGGHTEVTEAVTRFVVVCTAIGRCPKSSLIKTSNAKPGDSLVLTKHAGLEGASIIAREKCKELSNELGEEIVKEAEGFIENISSVKDGLIAASYGVNAMHDVTEGGVLGAVWEICEASGNGAEIYIDKIPVALSTRKICEYYGISPYKLMSSGCMLISAKDGEGLAKHLKSAGVSATVIGVLKASDERTLVSGGIKKPIPQPGPDELYKILRLT